MKIRKGHVRLGAGSAEPADRIEPVIELAEKGDVDYLCFDSLSETELINCVNYKISNPDKGYDMYTERRLRSIMSICARNRIRIIGNMGGANPNAAQDLAIKIARELGLKGMKIAAVTGDDVLQIVKKLNLEVKETDKRVNEFRDKLIAAHAYIPVIPLVEALQEGADIVIAGRVADASLFLAPLMYEFGWKEDDWDYLAKGIIIGHLMECGGQLSGGYFPDPPYKEVPDLYRLGFPIAEVSANGDTIITKVPGSGGLVSPATCAEQMLYEVGDPCNYIEADVIADFQDIGFEQVGKDRVAITGLIKGKPRPETLKVELVIREGYAAESVVFYAGPGAYERAKLAADTMRKRLELITKIQATELRFDFIGMGAIYAQPPEVPECVPWEVGVRGAVRTEERWEAWKLLHEFQTIDNNGPAGIARGLRAAGGEDVREILGYYWTLIPRDKVRTKVLMKEA